MAAYIVATVRVVDQGRFDNYSKSIAGLSERYGGKPVVRGPVVEVMEGNSPVGERVVVTQFENAEAARGYISSAEYISARAAREGAAQVEMRLLID